MPATQSYNGNPTSTFSPGYPSGSISTSGPPQLSSLPFQTSQTQLSMPYQSQAPLLLGQSPYSKPAMVASGTHLSPLKPVFGLSLNELFKRDGSAVPMVVYQCIQAVDLFGLEVEGIYRLSGTASHITKIKAMFDNGKLRNRFSNTTTNDDTDSSEVDFRNPESFFHDVNSVAGLLKQFFRDLPDPLLTTENYAEFIDAASK